jgi:uncharacterized protein
VSPAENEPASASEAVAAAGSAIRGRSGDRLTALAEVTLCSGFPTQIAVAALLLAAGVRPFDSAGQLSLTYVSWLSLIDAGLLVGLILMFLRIHGEAPREVLIGSRPIAREALVGLPLVLMAGGLVLLVSGVIQTWAPWLHNVARNPLEGLVRSAHDAWAFGLVAVVFGVLREEIQRAFVLRRFEQHLGGAWVGIVLFSLTFGAGHLIQGWDAMIQTSLLGAFWGLVYLKRGSVVAPAVSHAGFNAAEIFRYTLYGL